MAVNLPAALNEDNIPVILTKQLGIRLWGDAQLNLLAGMPLPLSSELALAAVTTVATTAGAAAPDITKLTAALTQRKVAK